MIPITYLKGDATKPIGKGHKYIAHICNDRGAWGAGFVLDLRRAFPSSEQAYRRWSKESTFFLGAVQCVDQEHHITVCNMIAQTLGDPTGVNIRYAALDQCLGRLWQFAQGAIALYGATSVHMPRIGCGLAGATWGNVEPLIVKHLCNNNVPVYVYDLQ